MQTHCRVTQHSESEAGMLSFSKSFGKKIRKLFSSLDIKHLDPLLFNALMDEDIMHCNHECNVLGLLVVNRVLSKAQRAFVVTQECHLECWGLVSGIDIPASSRIWS